MIFTWWALRLCTALPYFRAFFYTGVLVGITRGHTVLFSLFRHTRSGFCVVTRVISHFLFFFVFRFNCTSSHTLFFELSYFSHRELEMSRRASDSVGILHLSQM
jgi:hypothetical protein